MTATRRPRRRPWYRWPKGLRQAILERDNHLCQIRLPGCTMTADTVDHIRPVSQGGAWFEPTNLRAACRWCNTSRGDGRPTSAPTQSPNW